MPRFEEETVERAVEPEPPRGLTLDIVVEAEAWQALGPLDGLLAPVLDALSCHPAFADRLPADACAAFMDDAAMRQLNARFRGKDKPTNVLSFPSASPAGEPASLGDIALGYETVMREAAEQGIAAADHIRHLVLHGLLHLIGYDHETDAEAAVMEQLEIDILASIGIASPYVEAADGPAA